MSGFTIPSAAITICGDYWSPAPPPFCAASARGKRPAVPGENRIGMGAFECKVASITLPEVKIGDFVARNIDAAISQRDLPESRPLGMSIQYAGGVLEACNGTSWIPIDGGR